MQNKLSLVIDSAVLFVGVGVLIFSWVRFYTKSITLSLVAGVIIACMILLSFIYIYNKRNAKQNIKKAEQKQFEQFKFNLFFTPKAQTLDYFSSILGKTKNIEKHSDYLILKENSAQNDTHSTLHSTIFFAFFDKEKLDFSTFLTFYRIAIINNLDDIIICANAFEEDVKSNASKIRNMHATLLPLTQFFKENQSAIIANPFPIVADTLKPKLSKNEILRYAFSPARARNYLLFGLMILLTSFLVPFKIYYLIMGSLLCLTALFVKVIPLLKKQ